MKFLLGATGIGLGTTIKYSRRTTSAAAEYGLGTTMKSLLGATGIGLGTTIKYLRRITIASAGNGYQRRVQRPLQRSSACDAQRAPPRTKAW
jgi:hypothetical protein